MPESAPDKPPVVQQDNFPPKIYSNHLPIGDGFFPINILLKGRRKAQILVPEDLKKTDFDTIIDWIKLMKDQVE